MTPLIDLLLNDSSWVTPIEWPVQMASMKVSDGLHGIGFTVNFCFVFFLSMEN